MSKLPFKNLVERGKTNRWKRDLAILNRIELHVEMENYLLNHRP